MTDPVKSAAATLVEIKTACPGAPSDFVLQQLELGATPEAASRAWALAREAALKADLEKAQDELAKSQAELAKARQDRGGGGGLRPLNDSAADDGDGDGDGGDVATEYEAAIRQVMKDRGMSYEKAASHVNRYQPALRDRYQAAMAADWDAAHAR